MGGALVFSGWEVAVTSRRPPFLAFGRTAFPSEVASTAISDKRLEMDVSLRRYRAACRPLLTTGGSSPPH
jgi:hypothetical protein